MKIATVLTGVVGLLLLACNERPDPTTASDTQQDTTDVAVRKTVTSPADTLLGEMADTFRARAWLDSARSLFRNESFNAALVAAQRASEMYANDKIRRSDSLMIVAQTLVGEILWRDGKYDSSIVESNFALTLANKTFKVENIIHAQIYNNLGVANLRKRNYKIAMTYLKKSKEIRERVLGKHHRKTGIIYLNIGLVLDYLGEYNEALKYYNKALANFLKNGDSALLHTVDAYVNIGAVLYTLGKFDKAQNYYEKALEILEKHNANSRKDLLYNNVGLILSSKADYAKSIVYLKKALRVRRQISNKFHPRVRQYHFNIGAVYEMDGDLDSALVHLFKALEIQKKRVGGDCDIHIGNTYNSIALVYSGKDEFEKASHFFDLSLGALTCSVGENHPYVANNYHGRAALMVRRNKYDEALNLLRRELEVRLKVNSKKHPNIAGVYREIGDIYLIRGEYEDAKLSFDRSLDILNFSSTDSLSRVSDIIKLKRSFESIRQYYDQKSTMLPGRNYEDSLLNHLHKMMSIENYIQQEVTTSITRQELVAKSIPLFEHVIEKNINQNPVKWGYSFQVSEKTKSRQLTERIQSASYTVNFGLPDSLRNKEYELSRDIAYYEKLSFQEEYENESTNDSLLNAYENKIFELKRKQDELLKTFKTDYPDYYNLRYSTQVISVAGVQDSLLGSGKEALVEYFVGDSAIYVFTILQDTFHIHEVERDFPLQQWVRDMRCGIFAGHTQDPALCGETEEKAARESYTTAAHQLYQKLFAPVDSLLPAGATVTIVPDGLLGYVPFEALLTAKPEEGQPVSNYAYLLRDHTLSYAYSATLQKEMHYQQHRRAPGRNLLAVAPSFEADSYSQADTSLLAITRAIDTANSRSQLQPLEYNVPEAEAVAQLVGGELLTGAAATEAAFRERAGDYRLLHLSTHGKANDKLGDYSFLAFQPQEDSLENEWLYNRELYNLDLNADMVVLSACETGIGELRRGEGIISLARGFSYAGAKSIVTSLWSVDDQSAKVLMEYFYANLQEGMPKDKALRRAKLAYLEQHPNLGRSPFFWAAFIPIGDMSPVALSQGPGLAWWIGGAVLLLAVGFFGWRHVRGGS